MQPFDHLLLHYLELVRNSHFKLHLRSTESETLGLGPVICFNKPSSDSDAPWNTRTIALIKKLKLPHLLFHFWLTSWNPLNQKKLLFSLFPLLNLQTQTCRLFAHFKCLCPANSNVMKHFFFYFSFIKCFIFLFVFSHLLNIWGIWAKKHNSKCRPFL